ncbi:hypothetical protein SI65_04033 [Aspergillus cristatus]|uniref:Endonuclease/exonuclease/phosphatase domain-containing protein n=1 Tax=Aspergillus cristatus TaxID=573508 RepID=A0A1E3BJ41_ASPCR|nr:hypothetical protein SI65_04033 [Aspergillus cristatus]
MTKRPTSARKEVCADKLAAQLGKTRRKFEIPTLQPWYHFANGTWTSSTPPTTPSTTAPPRISVTTWNIDATAPASEGRMTAALSHLSDLHGSEDLPSIIFLQKCWMRISSKLKLRRGRMGFLWMLLSGVIESSAFAIRISKAWPSPSVDATRLYLHGPGRIPSPSDPTTTTTTTTDLPTPHAAILAGDLNANSPEDQPLPAQNNLQDAFLAPVHEREQFGCSRMDKVLFCGGVEVESLRRIGEGVEAWVEYLQWSDDEEDEETGENVSVTDHLGLEAVFRLV